MIFQDLIKSKLNAHPVNPIRKGTKSHDPLEIDRQFFKELSKDVIRRLYDDIYKTDFELLGYDYPQNYIDMGYDE